MGPGVGFGLQPIPRRPRAGEERFRDEGARVRVFVIRVAGRDPSSNRSRHGSCTGETVNPLPGAGRAEREKKTMSETCSACGGTFETKEQLRAHAAKAHPMGTKPLWPPAVNRGSYLRWAALGGLLGGIGMAVVMMVAGQALLGSGIAIVSSLGVAVFGGEPSNMATTVGGLLIHVSSSILIGVVIAALTLVVRNRFRGRLAITNAKNGAGLGLLAGFVVWLVWGLPLMFVMLIPAMETVMMAMPVNGMMPTQADLMTMLQSVMMPLMAAWFLAHLVYGGIWGAVTGYAAGRRSALPGGRAAAAGVSR